MAKLENALKLIKILSLRDRMNVDELAELLEVKPRMVRIYITEIKKAGIHVESFPGLHGGYSINIEDLKAALGLD